MIIAKPVWVLNGQFRMEERYNWEMCRREQLPSSQLEKKNQGGDQVVVEAICKGRLFLRLFICLIVSFLSVPNHPPTQFKCHLLTKGL